AAPGPMLARLAPAVAVGALAAWAWPQLADATRLWIWDDYTYHLVYPALWLREHAIAAVTPAHAFTMQAWYPLSASVVATWFMAPFAPLRGDALAWVSLTGVLYGALVATGMATLLARLGCRAGAWALPVAAFATSPRIGIMASSFSDADLAHAAALFAAVVLAVQCAEAERSGDIVVDTVYAALLSGVALGMKVSAAPAAAIVLVMLVLRTGTVTRWPRALAQVGVIAAAGWTATAGYWYLRNVAHTGNPVYPAKFLWWPGGTFPHTTLREYAAHYGLARTLRDALAVYLDWPLFHALLAVAGLGGLAVVLAVRRGAVSRAQRYFAGGALAIAIVTLLALPSTPYSAGNGMTFVSGFIHWDSMRYVALLPLLGWTAAGMLLAGGAGAPASRLVAGLVVIAAMLGLANVGLVAGASALGVAFVYVVLAARAPALGRRAALAVVLLLTGAAAAGVAFAHRGKAEATGAAFFREPLYGRALAVLDREAPGTRVALYGDQWVYPAFGSRHHLVPVRLDGDGRLASLPIGDAMTPGPLTVDPHTFRANLRTAGVGVIAVVHLPHPGRAPDWPPQATALDAVGGVRLLYRDAAVGLWKVEGP
ncbi:MAG: hypothetical protein FJ027_18140, partial [Candidatus Rokubacteria bacterium]|nr:hypothetical protein [Candidatus Rokubacteria bacterium]